MCKKCIFLNVKLFQYYSKICKIIFFNTKSINSITVQIIFILYKKCDKRTNKRMKNNDLFESCIEIKKL